MRETTTKTRMYMVDNIKMYFREIDDLEWNGMD
jgi:hypothetical protein